MAEFKLKPLKGEQYPKDRCVVARCQAEAELVDATYRFSPVDAPMCCACFARRPDPPCTQDRGVALGTCQASATPWKVPQEQDVPERAHSATPKRPGNDQENDPPNVPGPVRNRRLFG